MIFLTECALKRMLALLSRFFHPYIRPQLNGRRAELKSSDLPGLKPAIFLADVRDLLLKLAIDL